MDEFSCDRAELSKNTELWPRWRAPSTGRGLRWAPNLGAESLRGRRAACIGDAVRAFLSGFVLASGLWGALAFLYLGGYLDSLFPEEEPAPVASAAAPADSESAGPPTKGKRRGLKRPRLQRRAP